MPIYKNVSDKDVSGIVGIGLIKAGEIKTVADAIEHPSLKLLTEEEATAILDPEKKPAAQTPVPPIVSQPAAPATPPVPPQQPANVTPTQGAE